LIDSFIRAHDSGDDAGDDAMGVEFVEFVDV